MILYSHRKKFVAPSRSEGFTETLSIPFEPKFESNFEHQLYYSYLPWFIHSYFEKSAIFTTDKHGLKYIFNVEFQIEKNDERTEC